MKELRKKILLHIHNNIFFFFYFNPLFLCLTYRITFSSLCSERAMLYIEIAVCRGFFQKDQICVSVRLESLESRFQHPSASSLSLPHFLSDVEFLFQNLSNLEKLFKKQIFSLKNRKKLLEISTAAAVFGNLQCFWAPFKNNGGKFKNLLIYILTVTYHSKRRYGSPTGFQFARSWNTVTFTIHFHVSFQKLKKKKKKDNWKWLYFLVWR